MAANSVCCGTRNPVGISGCSVDSSAVVGNFVAVVVAAVGSSVGSFVADGNSVVGSFLAAVACSDFVGTGTAVLCSV